MKKFAVSLKTDENVPVKMNYQFYDYSNDLYISEKS